MSTVSPATLQSQAIELCQNGKVDAAIGLIQSWLTVGTPEPALYRLLAILYRMIGQLETALAYAKQAHALSPQCPDLNEVLGVLYQEADELELAATHLRFAHKLHPQNSQVRLNLANTCKRLGNLEEALALYDKVLQNSPDHAEAHYNRSLVHLLKGECEKAWPDYAWRFKTTPPIARFDVPFARWQGECLSAKTLLVVQEQGLGDTLLHQSVLPDLLQQGANVTFVIESRLIPLCQARYPDVQWQAKETAQFAEDYDYACPAADLLQFCKPVSAPAPLPASELSARLREKYLNLAQGRKLLGLSWRTQHPRYQSHCIALSELSPLFEHPELFIVNLQYDRCLEEVAEVARDRLLTEDTVDPMRQPLAFAAQIQALDGVVSIDNSLLPLSAGLGQKTFGLLPRVPNAFWGMTQQTNHWFPTLSLTRQSNAGQWQRPIQQVLEQVL